MKCWRELLWQSILARYLWFFFTLFSQSHTGWSCTHFVKPEIVPSYLSWCSHCIYQLLPFLSGYLVPEIGQINCFPIDWKLWCVYQVMIITKITTAIIVVTIIFILRSTVLKWKFYKSWEMGCVIVSLCLLFLEENFI